MKMKHCLIIFLHKHEENNKVVNILVRALNPEINANIDLNSEPVVYCELPINIRTYSVHALTYFFRIEFITKTVYAAWHCDLKVLFV